MSVLKEVVMFKHVRPRESPSVLLESTAVSSVTAEFANS